MGYHTLQQSAIIESLSTGYKESTDESCLGSHSRTHPSRPPETNSHGPYPHPSAPAPSIELTKPLCASTDQNTFCFSISRIDNLPSRSPKAKQRLFEGLAAKVPVFTPLLLSMLEITFNSPFVSWLISMVPLALGCYPQRRNLEVCGIHLTS